MSDSHFLDSIQQSPDDLTHRLVYADWLEENGDSRAEYLRIECEMATESLLEDRYWDLKERRNELRPNVDPDWRDKLGYGDIYRPMFTKLPSTRDELWRRVDRFRDLWFVGSHTTKPHISLQEIGVAEDRLNARFPVALREFYHLFGLHFPEKHFGTTCVKRPSEVKLQSGQVIIAHGFREAWGPLAADSEVEDPELFEGPLSLARVQSEQPSVRPHSTNKPLSIYLVNCLLHKAQSQAETAGTTDHFKNAPERFRQDLLGQYFASPVNVGIESSFTFYEGEDVLISINPQHFLRAAFRTQSAVDSVPKLLRDQLRLS